MLQKRAHSQRSQLTRGSPYRSAVASLILVIQLAVISGICSLANGLTIFSVVMVGTADDAVVVVVAVMAAVVAVGVASMPVSGLTSPLTCCFSISFFKLAISFGLQYKSISNKFFGDFKNCFTLFAQTECR